jgi:hypothetical protein
MGTMQVLSEKFCRKKAHRTGQLEAIGKIVVAQAKYRLAGRHPVGEDGNVDVAVVGGGLAISVSNLNCMWWKSNLPRLPGPQVNLQPQDNK